MGSLSILRGKGQRKQKKSLFTQRWKVMDSSQPVMKSVLHQSCANIGFNTCLLSLSLAIVLHYIPQHALQRLVCSGHSVNICSGGNPLIKSAADSYQEEPCRCSNNDFADSQLIVSSTDPHDPNVTSKSGRSYLSVYFKKSGGLGLGI